MLRWLSAGLVLVGLLMGCRTGAGIAHAQVPAEAEAYRGWAITGFEIEGVPSGHASRIRKGLVLTGTSRFLGRDYPPFFPEDLETDLRRIRLYLARNGYPAARVSVRFDPASRGRRVEMTIAVEPGDPVRIREVRIEGIPEPVRPRGRNALTTERGAVFSEGAVAGSAEALRGVLENEGYARASVTPGIEVPDGGAVITYRVDPGRVYRFGDIRVRGIDHDLVPLAQRTINLRRGQTFSARSLYRAQENLRLLNLFKQIRIRTADAAPDTLDVVATLSEREPRTIEVRAGWFSEDKLRARFSWEHRNLFREGRGVGVLASASIHLVKGEVSFWWPALVAPRTREMLKLRVQKEIEDNYTQIDGGVEISSVFRPSLRTTLQFSLAASYIKVDEDIATPGFDAEGIIYPLGGSWTWDTTDNPIDPRRGRVTWAKAEWTLPGISDNEYLWGEIGGSLYHPFLGWGVVAARLVLGAAAPLGDTESLIPGKRFYAGGQSSNRGFERRKLGPLDASLDPLGGEAMAVSMTEVRLRLFWVLDAAVFLDVGQVWGSPSSARVGDLEASAGPAIMVMLPFGPLRLDYGIRLRDPGPLPRKQLHFSIGHPF